MKRSTNLLLVTFLTTLIVACASNKSDYTFINHYRATEETASFTTPLDIEEFFNIRWGAKRKPQKLRVLRGKYVSKYVSSDGIFYQGKDRNIEHILKTTEYSTFDTGGFFVPFDINQPIKLWYDRNKRISLDSTGKVIPIFTSSSMATSNSRTGHINIITGIGLSPPISTLNDREIKLLLKNKRRRTTEVDSGRLKYK